MHRTSFLLTVMLLLLGCTQPADSPSISTQKESTQVPTIKPTATDVLQRNTATPRSIQRYSDPQLIAKLLDSGYEEAFLTPVDANGDGYADILVVKQTFQATNTYPIDILINDRHGGLNLATSELFSSGEIPQVQNPRQNLVADFNNDGRDDIYIADHGYDVAPHPGYQNNLILSSPDGKLVDAIKNIPQLSDFTHSACAGDIDNDGDMDIYVGNIWGQNEINPYLLINDGTGVFARSVQGLPPSLDLSQNGFTACAFADVNNDSNIDLILGDAGDDLSHSLSTYKSAVLLNDGTGVFTLLPDAMPPKDYANSDISHDIEAIDINGDQYLDLFIEYERQPEKGSYIQVLINNQDGTFRNETKSRLDPLPRQVFIPELELRDINNDGFLDLIAIPWDWQNPTPIVFANDGNGHFNIMSLELEVPYLYFTLIDIDKDNDDDIVYWADDIYLIKNNSLP